MSTAPSGIAVSFTCPTYRTSSAGTGFSAFAGSESYTVAFADSPALGSDGRLLQANWVDFDTAHTTGSTPQGHCVSFLFENASGRSHPQEIPGTYYWQVARICVGCPLGYETSAVRSFTLAGTARLKVGGPARAYSGYDRLVPLTLKGVPDQTRVALKRRVGRAWKTIGSAVAAGERGAVVVRLKTGKQRVRVSVKLGTETTTSPVRTIKVSRGSKAKRKTTRRDAGRWKGKAQGRSFSFRVVKAGRELRGVKISVTTVCPTAGISPVTTSVGFIEMGRVRVAPDGRFVRVLRRDNYVAQISGRISKRRLREGRFQLAVVQCTGSGMMTAARS